MSGALRHPFRAALLVLLAAGLNTIPIVLPGGAHFFLAPFVYMPLVLLLPLPWGPLAAALAMAATLFTFNHPFVVLLATAEAAWLGFAARRWKRPAILYDAIFWGAAGIPVSAALLHGIGGHPLEIVAIIAGKQFVSQLAAVAIAAFLLQHTRLAAWLDDRAIAHRSMRDLTFHSVFVLATAPLLLVGVGVSVLLRAYCEREDRAVLVETGQRLSQQLGLFLQLHQAAVEASANTLSRGGDATALLEETRRAHPAFLTMIATDADGWVTHAAPAGGIAPAASVSVADRDYFLRARELDAGFVSGVFRGRGFGDDVIVAISAPWRDPAGKFAGVVEASLEVHDFARRIVDNRPENAEVALIFADSTGRVIYADPSLRIPPLARLSRYPQGALLAGAGEASPSHFNQTGPDGRTTRVTAYASRAKGSGVVVIAQRPLLAGLAGAAWVYALFGGVAACILAAATWVARTARRQVALPLERFAEGAHQQAALGTVAPIDVRIDEAPRELWTALHAFNRLATRLQGTYAMLQQANQELDQRVAERTAEAEAARRHAEASSRSKTDFLAMASHEIRTPLGAIIGLADALASDLPPPEAAARIETIRTSSHRLLTVVNDLLDLSRAEAGRLELRFSAVELGALCQAVCDLFALRAEQQGLRLDLELFAPRPLWLETDSARLQQVLINLVGNALKFTRAGRVCLRVEHQCQTETTSALRFSVTDTGPGIPTALQVRLFQPYAQLGDGAGPSAPGTGLGLFISRRLVNLFGGTLAVRSEAGAGAEFFFTIVVRRADAPLAEPAATPASPAAIAIRILAVDDNPANQEILRSLLRGRGAELVVVDDAQAALAALAHTRFDVALVDLELPDIDGFAVARTVRTWTGTEASRDCRLVAFSAYDRAQLWVQCAASGFDDYVEKPVYRQTLWRAVGLARPTRPSDAQADAGATDAAGTG
ncbi:MAG TPA: ATP-binding protein [Opitutaceae bacterium]